MKKILLIAASPIVLCLSLLALFMYALYLERKTKSDKEWLDSCSYYCRKTEQEFRDKCQELTTATFEQYSKEIDKIITLRSKHPYSIDYMCRDITQTIHNYKNSISEIEQEYIDIITKEFSGVDGKPLTNYAIRTLAYDCKEHIHKEAETFRKFGDLMWYEIHEAKTKS